MTTPTSVRAPSKVYAFILAALLAANTAPPAFANEVHRFEIRSADNSGAIHDFATQSGVQILAAGDVLSGKRLNSVSGEHSTDEGLRILLAGTGLTHQYIGDRAVALMPVANEAQASARAGQQSSEQDAARASFWDRFRMAQVDSATAPEGSPVAPAQNASDGNGGLAVEEIVVTAQKRIERLQDVPVPVTAISADTLVNSNQTRLQDYYAQVPGLSVTPGDYHGSPMLSIRGLTTGGSFINPTVGIVVDDVPYGSSTGIGGGAQAPDLDPSDLARIEVLRGPQGTLYGASSIGGLLKFVTVDPTTDRLSGRVQAGFGAVRGGDDVGYNVRGAVNVPVGDTFAFRVSGYTRRDPGYIDDPGLGKEGVNRTDADGGRLSAAWRPSETFSLKLSALLQNTDVLGSPLVDVQPGVGDLQHLDLLGTGAYNTRFQAYSATLNAKLGGIDVTSLSGYSVNTIEDSYDYTSLLGTLTESVFGTPGTAITNDNETTKYTQELRLSAPIGERFEWLLGAFYTHERSSVLQRLIVADTATGAEVAEWYHAATPTKYEEYAAFADLTFHVTDRFDLQVGGRESENKQELTQSVVGPLVGGSRLIPTIDSKEHAFTYLVTPRLKVTPDLMVYARLASGYRPGGPNTVALASGVPPIYDPDKTENYEIGVKGDLLGRALSFDASVYYIDWKDVQLLLVDTATGASYNANAGRAKSQGVELSVESHPVPSLALAAWAVWNEAELTEAFPPLSSAFGAKGDRLPFSSRFSGNVSVDQEFPVMSGATAFIGGTLSYVGDRVGFFTATPQRQSYAGYARTDVRAGVRYDTWTFNLFVNNITDKRAALTGGVGSVNPVAFNYIQPRTAGVSLAKSF